MQTVHGIAVYEQGSGLPVVLIHAFPMSHRMWEPQMPALAGFRVIRYDVRGLGASGAGDGQYSLESFVDDLFRILDHLQLKQAVLCGLSMGGYIALRAAERSPERVKALVLCDTKSEADGNEIKIKRAAGMAAVKTHGSAAYAAAFVKTVLSEKSLRTRPDLVESVKKIIAENKPLGIAGALLALASRTDTTAALPAMDFPVLILVGDEDRLTPPSAAEAMQRALPRARLHVIPNAGHLSNMDNPGVFNERLLEFLGTLR